MDRDEKQMAESPSHVRMSLAAAMTLGYKKGLFYRNARLYCINLLLTYDAGCRARCAYCGLSSRRPGAFGKKSFIRVTWPTYPVKDIIRRISDRGDRVKRICISMVTHPRAVRDTKRLCAGLRQSFDIPVSILVAPTVLKRRDLIDLRTAGADKAGVAVDLATPELFDRYRGAGVSGPHRWKTYWDCLSAAIDIFGGGNAGPHFMAGMGETEKEICRAIQRARCMGGRTHLFSFFPEADSALSDMPQPPMESYRRVQLARYLIDHRLGEENRFSYDGQGRITDFGISSNKLQMAVDSGEPFRTSGCTGYDGRVACNRPFANSRPGPLIRNYPFPPAPGDMALVKEQLGVLPITETTARPKQAPPSVDGKIASDSRL